MSDVLFKTFVTFFVIYALIDMFTKIFRFFAEERTRSEVIVVIRVKNQEENIEGVIRSVIWKFLSRSAGGDTVYLDCRYRLDRLHGKNRKKTVRRLRVYLLYDRGKI